MFAAQKKNKVMAVQSMPLCSSGNSAREVPNSAVPAMSVFSLPNLSHSVASGWLVSADRHLGVFPHQVAEWKQFTGEGVDANISVDSLSLL